MKLLSTVLLFAVHLAGVLAHGAPKHPAILARRDLLQARSAKLFSRCAAKLQTRAAINKREERTQSFVNSYLASRGIAPEYTASPNANATCVLAPEQEEGPFYTEGALLRNDTRETQGGVDLLVDIQLLNVRTCEPLRNVLVDFWACNATGVYGDIAFEGTLVSDSISKLYLCVNC